MSSYRFVSSLAWAGVVATCATPSIACGGIIAAGVIEYAPGTISSSALQQNGNAANGLPTSVDDGQTSPFTPPFRASSITIIGPGGHITLHMSEAIKPVDGPDIGIFTNTGLVASTSGGITTAAIGPSGTSVFSRDAAIVSVSQDGVLWSALASGSLLDLTMPSNAFTDAALSNTSGIRVSGGTTAADPFKPFTGTLNSFGGLTYPQMQTLLNGSFGGAWLDVSSSGLTEVNYIRFDVPAGSRLVLDAVTAIPEPASLSVLMAGAVGLLFRRSRRD